MARKQILGKVIPTFKGEYSSSFLYEMLDIVSYNGSSYISKADGNREEPTNTDNWQQLAKKGDTYEVNDEDLKAIADKIVNDANSTFNQNVTEKTNDFNENVDNKVLEYNGNHETKINEFNSNSETKLESYNANASTKLEEYNTNVDGKLEELNNNFDTKSEEFNSNANEKLNEFNENADSIINENKELKEELDSLKGILPKKIVVGTDVLSFDDAVEYQPLDLKIEGNSKQETTTGKNIVIGLRQSAINLVSYNIDDRLSKQMTLSFIPNFSLDQVSVYLRTISNVGVYRKATIDLIDGKKNVVVINLTDTEIDVLKSEEKVVQLYKSGSSEVTTIKEVQLESGTVATDFEPYSNGASPNPDYPQDIEVLKGHNLLNLKSQTIDRGIKTTKNEDGSYTISGTATETIAYLDLGQKVDLEAGEYTFSICDKLNAGLRLFLYDDANVQNGTMTINAGSTIANSKPTKDIKTLSLILFNLIVGETYNLTIKPQLISGTSEKPYLPYGKIGIKRIGKNKFNLNWFTDLGTKNGLTAKIENDHIVLNGTSIANTYFNFKIPDELIGKVNDVLFFKSDELIQNLHINLNGGSYNDAIATTWTRRPIAPNTDMLSGYINIPSGKTYTNCKIYISLVEDRTMTIDKFIFEPYQERIDYIDLNGNELLKGDVLNIQGKKAWIIKNLGKVVLDGTQGTYFDKTTRENTTRFLIQNAIKNDLGIQDSQCKSSHFIRKSSIYSNDSEGFYLANSHILYFSIKNTVANDVATFKNWLLENKPEIYYESTEPQIIELPDLEEPIKNLKGTNDVTVIASLEPSSLEETYVYDLEKEISDIKNIIISEQSEVSEVGEEE